MVKLLSKAKVVNAFWKVWFAILLLSCIFQGARSQNSSPFNQKVSGNYNNKTLKEVLTAIHEQTNVRFSYSPDKIPENTKVVVSFSNISIVDALEKVFQDLPVRYELVDNYIILKKAKEKAKEEIPEIKQEEKRVTFSGYIKDGGTSEFLIGATVFFKELGTGTITNNYGFFSHTVPPGKYTAEISYLGYERLIQNVELKSNIKYDFEMQVKTNALEEVVITSFQAEDIVFRMRGGQSRMTASFVAKKPSLMGEPDVIKSLEFQPGISFNGDGSSYFHVRGGNFDQNLILLDEATLFNPSHLLGIFSPIIPDAVSNVDIYKGDFPVNFGGILSSVIDIHTKDGNKNRFSGSLDLGLIATRGTIEGPIKKDASSYFLSFRKSHFDIFLKPSTPNLKGLYFNDFTSKINLKLGAKDRMFLTFFAGQDYLRTKTGVDDQSGLNWGNQTLTLRWNHVFGSQMFLNSSFYTSNYEYRLYSSVNKGEYWKSSIANQSLKEELTWYTSPLTTWKMGLKLSAYQFNPGNFIGNAVISENRVSPANSMETSIYAGAEQEINSWMKLNYGLRLVSWANFGEAFVIRYDSLQQPISENIYEEGKQYYSYTDLEPRISLSFKTGNQSGIKVAYSKVNQFLNLITNSISPFNSFEVWLPSGPNIKPQSAHIFDLGYTKVLPPKMISFQVNAFYKKMDNQIGYKYHANMLLNPYIEGELLQGRGWSYGLELTAKKELGKVTGQLSYTWSRSFMKINGLNNNKEFPATCDKPHNFTAAISYQRRARWMYSMDYCLSSGARVTTPTSFYYYQGYQVPQYSKLNNDRFPVYSRLDVSASHRLNKKESRFSHYLNFAILNLLGKQNPIFVYFNKTENVDGKLIIPIDKLNDNTLVPSVRYTYWIIPSITYQLKF